MKKPEMEQQEHLFLLDLRSFETALFSEVEKPLLLKREKTPTN